MCVCGGGGGRTGQTLSRFVCKASFGFNCSLTLYLLASSADNLLDPDQDRQNVDPDLDPNCLTL